MSLKKLHIYFFILFLPIASMFSAEYLFARQSGGQRNLSIDEYANRIFFSNIFIKAKANKKECFVGELFVVEYELYINDKIILTEVLEEKTPVFNDALVEEEDIGTLRYTHESIRGEVFRKAMIRKYVVIPTKEGAFEIPTISLKINASLEYSPEYPTDEKYYSRINTYSSEKIQINVKPILEKDENFIGAIGDFQIRSMIGKDKVFVNQNFEFIIEIIGSGNLYLIKAPRLKLSNYLQIVGETKVIDSIKVKNGLYGKRSFIYTLISQKKGKHLIPEQLFSYFAPEKGTSMSLKTKPHNIEVFGADEIKQAKESGGKKKDYISWIFVILGLLSLGTLVFLLRKINAGGNKKSFNQKLKTQTKQGIADEIRNFSSSNREIVLDFLFKSIIEILVMQLQLKKEELSVEKIRRKMIDKKFDKEFIEKVIHYLNELKRLRFYRIDEELDTENLKEIGLEIIERIAK